LGLEGVRNRAGMIAPANIGYHDQAFAARLTVALSMTAGNR
jgi:hypothetical protein